MPEPKKIKDLDIEEISLVQRAANRRTFSLTKEETKQMYDKLITLLKKWFSEEELTEERQAAIKAMPEDLQKANLQALEIMEEYREDDLMPEDFKKVMKAYIDVAISPKEKKEDKKETELTPDNFIEKAGAAFSKATKEQIEKAIGILNALLNKGGGEDKETKKGLTPEQINLLAKAQAIIDREELAKKAADEAKEKDRDSKIDDLLKQVAELKKNRGTSKQIQKDEEGEEDEDGKTKTKKAVVDKFPSIRLS